MCQLTGNNGTFLLEGVLPNNVTLLNKTAQGDSWEYVSDSGRRCCFAPFASGKLRCLDGNTKQGEKEKIRANFSTVITSGSLPHQQY